jgi:hypothetical protein
MLHKIWVEARIVRCSNTEQQGFALPIEFTSWNPTYGVEYVISGALAVCPVS